MPAVDKRLECIAGMVQPCHTLADIGTDHGKLVVALLRRGLCKQAYACDINAQPLAKAQAAIAHAGLGQAAQTILCDGLAGLAEKPCEQVIIAGMGGELIAAILQRSPLAGRGDIRYLLQPMTKPQVLRAYLYANGMPILEEQCVTQGQFTYSIMAARYTGESCRPTLWQRYMGGIVPEQNAHTRRYATVLLARVRRKIAGLVAGGAASPMLQELRQLEALLQERM